MTENNNGLRKDTNGLIECKISDCCPKDSFIVGTWGNQGTYKIESEDLLGNYEIKSMCGDTRRILPPNQTVWRAKRLHEILIEDPKEETRPAEDHSNLLIDIFKDVRDQYEVNFIR